MAVNTTVFSEFEVRQMNFILGDGEGKLVYPVECIGKVEEESEVRSIVKNKRGVPFKKRTWGTGAGTLKVTMHIPYELYVKLHGMEDDALAEGVYAYGRSSRHPEIVITSDVFDEDNVEKLKAWPNCVVSTGPARSVENGAEEVAEVDMEIGFSTDESDHGLYEALKSAVSEDIASAWMDSFAPDLVKAKEV